MHNEKEKTHQIHPSESTLSDRSRNEAVLMLRGNNMFGDPVYSYMRFTLDEFKRMRADMASGKNMIPSDYGEVLESGRGEPTDAVKERMRELYGVKDLLPLNKVDKSDKSTQSSSLTQVKSPKALPPVKILAPKHKEKQSIPPSFTNSDLGKVVKDLGDSLNKSGIVPSK
jgi:hypothetical protein